MQGREFARQLCAWVNPLAVVKAAQDADKLALKGMRFEVALPRPPGVSAKVIGLEALIDLFVANFELPGALVDLLAARVNAVTGGAAQSPPLDWDAVRAVRFTGEVRYPDPPAEGKDPGLVVVSEHPLVFPMVLGPMQFLAQRSILHARLWSKVGSGDFFEHSAYGELAVFIEATVARALGHGEAIRSAARSGKGHVIYGDGAFGSSMLIEPPFEKALVMRETTDSLVRGMRAEIPAYDYSAEVPAEHLPVGEADGFAPIHEEAAAEPWRNVAHWRNECSPYGLFRSRTTSGGPLVIDRYYGQVFDFPLHENRGVYGVTAAMPAFPSTRPADLGFLRLPYRKAPRFSAADRAELMSCLDSVKLLGDGSAPLYRGQTREYTLPRSANARAILYGDAVAVEPSLLASSERKSTPIEAVLPEWCALVRLFLGWVWGEQITMPELREVWRVIEEDAQRFSFTLDVHLYAIGMAQHYGLPSMGLDVTDSLDVALFFALHELDPINGDRRRLRARRKVAGDAPSVLYVLVPDERFRMSYDASRPRTLGGLRPQAQQAKFLPTGWGHSRNAGARAIALAVYLDPRGDFGPLPSSEELFPPRESDLFGCFLEETLEQGTLPPELRRFVEQLYWVVASSQ